ncbi:uncharacterized protein [Prorops nasuta]|uniref:uncharacterized protein n=1 Tax=Prorops nasuta TaxID=863751 RepID=UPI0034D00DDE
MKPLFAFCLVAVLHILPVSLTKIPHFEVENIDVDLKENPFFNKVEVKPYKKGYDSLMDITIDLKDTVTDDVTVIWKGILGHSEVFNIEYPFSQVFHYEDFVNAMLRILQPPEKIESKGPMYGPNVYRFSGYTAPQEFMHSVGNGKLKVVGCLYIENRFNCFLKIDIDGNIFRT